MIGHEYIGEKGFNLPRITALYRRATSHKPVPCEIYQNFRSGMCTLMEGITGRGMRTDEQMYPPPRAGRDHHQYAPGHIQPQRTVGIRARLNLRQNRPLSDTPPGRRMIHAVRGGEEIDPGLFAIHRKAVTHPLMGGDPDTCQKSPQVSSPDTHVIPGIL
ncbi:MAG: hypothetical protein GX837_01240 [Methanomicrobiales archaeon]|jgi:hypothetical protein|nr:hypothetical protein [Methanomicrobiales archaeon]